MLLRSSHYCTSHTKEPSHSWMPLLLASCCSLSIPLFFLFQLARFALHFGNLHFLQIILRDRLRSSYRTPCLRPLVYRVLDAEELRLIEREHDFWNTAPRWPRSLRAEVHSWISFPCNTRSSTLQDECTLSISRLLNRRGSPTSSRYRYPQEGLNRVASECSTVTQGVRGCSWYAETYESNSPWSLQEASSGILPKEGVTFTEHWDERGAGYLFRG